MSRIKNAVSGFHNNEAGNEAIQTVAILAVGAMVLVALNAIWNSSIRDSVVARVEAVFSATF